MQARRWMTATLFAGLVVECMACKTKRAQVVDEARPAPSSATTQVASASGSAAIDATPAPEKKKEWLSVAARRRDSLLLVESTNSKVMVFGDAAFAVSDGGADLILDRKLFTGLSTRAYRMENSARDVAGRPIGDILALGGRFPYDFWLVRTEPGTARIGPGYDVANFTGSHWEESDPNNGNTPPRAFVPFWGGTTLSVEGSEFKVHGQTEVAPPVASTDAIPLMVATTPAHDVFALETMDSVLRIERWAPKVTTGAVDAIADSSFAPKAMLARSGNDAWLVGTSTTQGKPLFLHFDGKKWSSVPGPPVASGEATSIQARKDGALFTVIGPREGQTEPATLWTKPVGGTWSKLDLPSVVPESKGFWDPAGTRDERRSMGDFLVWPPAWTLIPPVGGPLLPESVLISSTDELWLVARVTASSEYVVLRERAPSGEPLRLPSLARLELELEDMEPPRPLPALWGKPYDGQSDYDDADNARHVCGPIFVELASFAASPTDEELKPLRAAVAGLAPFVTSALTGEYRMHGRTVVGVWSGGKGPPESMGPLCDEACYLAGKAFAAAVAKKDAKLKPRSWCASPVLVRPIEMGKN
ncbi:MAG: hypothetical protein ABI175_20920 [Polyangiales bacterium]